MLWHRDGCSPHIWESPFLGGRFRVSFRLEEVAWNAALKAQGLRPASFIQMA
jgi:hypothetical protein